MATKRGEDLLSSFSKKRTLQYEDIVHQIAKALPKTNPMEMLTKSIESIAKNKSNNKRKSTNSHSHPSSSHAHHHSLSSSSSISSIPSLTNHTTPHSRTDINDNDNDSDDDDYDIGNHNNDNHNSYNNHDHPRMNIISILSDCDPLKPTKWSWYEWAQFIIKYMTLILVTITIFAMILAIIIAKKHSNNNNINAKGNMRISTVALDQLLSLKTSGNTNGGQQLTNENGQSIFEDILNGTTVISMINSIETRDTTSVFLRESMDDTIRFLPFRKPKDGYCSVLDYSFNSHCVNIHNVRSVSFESSELTFLVSSSYPRILKIENPSETEIILNDRIFSISDDDRDDPSSSSLREVTDSSFYQNGGKFCANNVWLIGGSSMVISGSCYGLLYIPKRMFDRLSLFASGWSSIIVDSKMHSSAIVVAANEYSSVVFRSFLSAESLDIAITDESYVEFKKVASSNDISMIALQKSQIYVGTVNDCVRMDLQSLNQSLIEILHIRRCASVSANIKQFSSVSLNNIVDSVLTIAKQPNTVLNLPANNDYLYQNMNDEDGDDDDGNHANMITIQFP